LARRVSAAHHNDRTRSAEKGFGLWRGVVNASSLKPLATLDIQPSILCSRCNQEALGSDGRAAARFENHVAVLEKGKLLAADKVFLERIEREVRRGGRMAIVADVRIPDLAGGLATVVNVHLENKCKPECRTKQMDALLSRIHEVDGPVIVAGDLNTTGFDGTPTSIRREILKRVKNYEFWVTQALKWATPASLPLAALMPVKYYRNYLDPTAAHVPFIDTNKEAILFRHVERFRFADHKAFDFRGDEEHNLHGKGRTLANSNQRARKGFEPTFTLKRDFGGWLAVTSWIGFSSSLTSRSLVAKG
jgi:hypothetical protein